jgi:WS/DGAT/MGAT family acyltransferase
VDGQIGKGTKEARAVEAIQLSAFDSSFLALDGPVSVGHVLTVTPLDRLITLDDVRRHVAPRLHRIPIMRRKLRASAVKVGRPWWVDDQDFDIDNHLFVSELGGDARGDAIAAEMVRINLRKLDRSHPLWEIHLVTGLADGTSVLATKLHHSAADGVGARDLLIALFGPPDPSDYDGLPWAPDPPPGAGALLSHGVTELGSIAASAVRLTGRAAVASPRLVRRSTELVATNLANQLDKLLEPPPTDGDSSRRVRTDTHWAGETIPRYPPDTPFSGALTADRAWAYSAVPTIESRSMRRSTGTTVNDLFVAMSAGALRVWLQRRDALPNDPLMALVPISTRDTPVARGIGNHITLSLCPLPTHLATPHERLAAVHRDMLESKRSPTLSKPLLSDVMAVSAPTMATLLNQVAARIHLANKLRLPFHVMISNVPSPGMILRVADAEIVDIHPFPPLSDGLGLNITGHGYKGDLGMGISSCPDMLEDPYEIVELMREEHARLCELRMPE